MSLTIDTQGNRSYNPRNAVIQNGSVTEGVAVGGNNGGTRVGGVNATRSVKFDNGLRPSDGGVTYSYANTRTAPTPVGSVGGQTFYDQASYQAALEQQRRVREEEERQQREHYEEQAANMRRTASGQSDAAAASGLDTQSAAEQASESEQRRQQEQQERDAGSTLTPSVSMVGSQSSTSSSSVGGGEDVATASTAPSPRMNAVMDAIDQEYSDGSRTMYVSPSDIERSLVEYGVGGETVDDQDQRVLNDMLVRMNEARADNPLNRAWDYAKRADNPLNREWGRARASYAAERAQEAAERERLQAEAQAAESETDEQVTEEADDEVMTGRIPSRLDMLLGDEVTEEYLDLGKAGTKSEEAQLRQLQKYQVQKSAPLYKEVADSLTSMRGQGLDKEALKEDRPWNQPEWKIKQALSKAGDILKLRLINPSLLAIEGQHVETVKSKSGRKTITRGRIRYSEAVEEQIKMIKDIYGCSTRTVLSLIMLRAGLGVDIKGTIGGKNPTKFKLSEAQFIELANDIETSQRLYGHPMALVHGVSKANGVRDNSGRFVVVSGTRCFPAGYIPTFILNDLMDCPDFNGLTVGDVQNMIRDSWVNDTYRELVTQSRADDKVMWQARAIENMMRTLMSFDGIDSEYLRIPELVINKSMMQMQTEAAVAGDPQMKRSMDEREHRERIANEKVLNRYVKRGNRNPDGSFNNDVRNGNMIDDVARGISSIQKACKAADVFLLITSPLEAMQSMAEQSVADRILKGMFEVGHKGVLDNYQVSQRLTQAASSRQGVEARTVAESLYRIGGWNMIDAFFSQEDANGEPKYRLNKADLRRFLADYGVTGEAVPSRLMDLLHIDPVRAPAFLANINSAVNYAENIMLGSGDLFQEKEASHFVEIAMLEMARASVSGGESYTGAEVDQWAALGGEEVMRGLLRTDAGREAFMTQGVTSLGRKSPVDYAMRRVMAANGVTELAVRTFLDRFPEYGLNKFMRQIPFSNTMSYLGSYGVDGFNSFMGRILESSGMTGAEAFINESTVSRYQVGGRNTFLEGLTKNLVYDCVMAANRVAIGWLYYGLLTAIGGVHRPPSGDDDDDENLTNWSEWIIGDSKGRYGMPLQWAWFVDDLSGIGLPLGMAFAICSSESDSNNPLEWTPEAKDLAAEVFVNAMYNFNDSTVVFDCIDLMNNYESEIKDFLNPEGTGSWLHPSSTEWRQTSLELGAWKFLGSMTPTVVKQVLPWSRDFLFRGGDPWQRDASKVYNNGDRYTMEEAIQQYRVKDVDSYHEYMIRREAQNNPLAALAMDLFYRSGWASRPENQKTGYMFTEQPYRTKTDELARQMWDFYSFNASDLTGTNEEKQEKSRAWAEWVCTEIDKNFSSASDAASKGFVINPDTREACREYTNWMFSKELDRQFREEVRQKKEEFGVRYLDDKIYKEIEEKYEKRKQHYKLLYEDYFKDDTYIPYRLPRYNVLDSDTSTRFVDENGHAAVSENAVTLLNMPGIRQATDLVGSMLGINTDFTPGRADRYYYGNRPNALPHYSPEPTLRLDNETEPYYLGRDEDGNVTSDTKGLYDLLGNMGTRPGETEEQADARKQDFLDLRDKLFDGGASETPTTGERGLERLDVSMPNDYKGYYDPEQASKVLGFPAFDKSKSDDDDDDDSSGSNGKNGSNGGNSYYRRGGGGGRRYYYSGGGGFGGYSSSYNPKIYSTPRQVYSQRASGMQTRQPYKATSTYLRPAFYTSGSRKSWRRQQ